MSPDLTDARPPLTMLTEQERMFQEAARDFAESEVRPKTIEMDRAQAMDPDLIRKLFELGLMAIEIPEEHGGAGADFFSSALVVEELSRVDPSVAVIVDVQNTLVINALLRWASPDQQARHLPSPQAETLLIRRL